jgi:PEP-CTERM motif
MLKTALIGAAMLCGVATAHAAVILDQSFVVPAGGFAPVVATVGDRQPAGQPLTAVGAVQTFTAGKSGILDHLEFQAGQLNVANNGLIGMSLIDGDYEAGARTVIAQSFTVFSVLPDLTGARNGTLSLFFDTSVANFFVTPGQRYSVQFDAVSFTPLAQAGLVIGYVAGTQQAPTFFGSGYTGGKLYALVNGEIPAGQSAGSSLYDVGFRSYVDEVAAPAVPEPATWTMMIAGFGLAGAALRRRVVAITRRAPNLPRPA